MALFEARAQPLLVLGVLLGSASCAVYSSDLVDGSATLLSTGGAMTGGGAAGAASSAAAGNSAGDCSDCYEPEVVAGASGMDGGGGSDGGAPAGGGGGAASSGSHSSGGAAGASSGGAGGSGGTAGATSTPPCAGKQVSGHCLYLGATGASCAQSCVGHGGVAANASSFLGTPAQGGTVQHCAEAFQALGVDAVVTQARRTDGRGLGCHLYGSDPYWLTSPAFSASAQYPMARVVCACAE